LCLKTEKFGGENGKNGGKLGFYEKWGRFGKI
jgi:hypothetical protein